MTKIRLGQDWVSRVTTSKSPDISVISTDIYPLPDAAQLQTVIRTLAASEGAREMVRRRWLQPTGTKDRVAARGEALFDFLFTRRAYRPAAAMFKGRRLRAQRDLFDEVFTMSWIAHVADTARSQASKLATFQASSVTDEFLGQVIRLSASTDGPKQALNALREIGINVVVESGLPGMSVDGASFHTADVGPVLAMTLRHDRLDNFWFTLLHELGHIVLHLSEPSADVFVDSLEDGVADEQEAEAEANAFAKDSLIPRDTWLRSDARRNGDETSVVRLARQLGIHPAIVAGRIRYERHEFRIFTNLVGYGQVREYIFTD